MSRDSENIDSLKRSSLAACRSVMAADPQNVFQTIWRALAPPGAARSSNRHPVLLVAFPA